MFFAGTDRASDVVSPYGCIYTRPRRIVISARLLDATLDWGSARPRGKGKVRGKGDKRRYRVKKPYSK